MEKRCVFFEVHTKFIPIWNEPGFKVLNPDCYGIPRDKSILRCNTGISVFLCTIAGYVHLVFMYFNRKHNSEIHSSYVHYWLVHI
jgi:hypothetical protein